MVLTSQRRKELREQRRNKAIELLGGKCVKCGGTDRLQFDHIDNDRKDYKGMISYLLQSKWEFLIDELVKCQLLCISCHAIKTGEDRSAKELIHGLLSTYTNRKCRCTECRKINAHHTRQLRLKRVE